MACAVVVASRMLLLVQAQDDIGYDTVSMALNQQISPSKDYLNFPYSGGKGILVRSPDGYEDESAKLVVPSTLWSNDLFMPSQIYPDGDPNCPNGDQQCDADSDTGELGPWNDPQMGAVIGSMMGELMPNFDNIQDYDWGWGVFYSTDSNAVDGRCRWRSDDGGYDCPKGWLDWGQGFNHDDQFSGAGGYTFGNPYADGGGGGAGCHFNSLWDTNPEIDQINGDDGQGTALVQDQDCQCNYDLLQNAGDWVDQWLQYGGYSGPSSSMDVAACWVSNPRDLIKLQNELFWRRYDWNDGSHPFARWDTEPASQRPYWGWNEIPVDNVAVNNPLNWDAIMIKLPAMLEGDGSGDRLSMLSWGQGVKIEHMLAFYIDKGMLVPGSDNVMNRPGSFVVLVREWLDGSDNYQREFFCETWSSPNGYFQIWFFGNQGACYVDYGSSSARNSAHHLTGAEHNSTHGSHYSLGRTPAALV